MNEKFTVDEIKDAARMARVYCPGFNEDMFESLMELEKRIAESGYLDAVMGLIRLQNEKGISWTVALDACYELLEQKQKLEKETTELQNRVKSLSAELKQVRAEFVELKNSTEKTKQELVQARTDYAAADKKLEALYKRTENEKQRIDKELADSYQQANITKEDVMAAGKLKADMESHGFSLELMLDLSQEFASHKNAREQLAEGLKAHGSLNKYLNDLDDFGKKEKSRVTAGITVLESQKKTLVGENGTLRNILSQLQADIANEEALRQFHRRYAPVSWLLDKLASWNQVYFMRCGNPINMAAGVIDKKLGSPHFWTDAPPTICPHCGCRPLFYDTEVYQFLNWPVEIPLKLKLGD